MLKSLLEGRPTPRRIPSTYEQAVEALRDWKYTGKTVTNWHQGVEKSIEIPDAIVIDLKRD